MSKYERFGHEGPSLDEADDGSEVDNEKSAMPEDTVLDLRPATTNGSAQQFENDNIVVEVLEEFEGDEKQDQVLERAKDFFLEHNDNYSVSWEEAEEGIAEVEEDPSNPPIRGWNWPYVRWRLRRVVESLWFRLLTMLLIIIDLCVVLADITTYQEDQLRFTNLQVVDLVITVWFVVELGLRIISLTHPVFFSTWYNVVDFAVVLITFIIVCVAASGTTGEWAEKLSVITVLRLVRIVRLVRLCTEKKQLETAARQMVSQNKRRYQMDGYDLDLTYVTQRIIATSFPSTGMLALYRNPIEKVAAFLNDKHKGKYRMYNLCSERTYETHHFQGCTVERYLIDDHNVPTLEDMVRFTKSVKEWLSADKENVIVVHCKGGKGRTGTMICVWLVEAGIFSSASQSLDYFGNRRTDTNVGKKFQGVETPSQSRYVGYYEMILHNGGVLPAPHPLIIKEFNISGMKNVGQGNGDDFWISIDRGRGNQVFSAHIGYRRNCQAEYNAQADRLTVTLVNCPRLDGDIRVLFQTTSKDVPKGYEKAPFYFWFNTAFVGEKLALKRQDLDNPHKPKTWHCFRPEFCVETTFQFQSDTTTSE